LTLIKAGISSDRSSVLINDISVSICVKRNFFTVNQMSICSKSPKPQKDYLISLKFLPFVNLEIFLKYFSTFAINPVKRGYAG
jgi:hypothetical protein